MSVMSCEESVWWSMNLSISLKMQQTYCSVEKDNIYNSKVRLNSLNILILFPQT